MPEERSAVQARGQLWKLTLALLLSAGNWREPPWPQGRSGAKAEADTGKLEEAWHQCGDVCGGRQQWLQRVTLGLSVCLRDKNVPVSATVCVYECEGRCV